MTDHLLPSSSTQFERDVSSTVGRLENLPVPIREIHSADDCPEPLLPWLAWAFSVEDWEADWPEERKREVISASFGIHMIKGTPGAVEDALRALGYENVEVIEGTYSLYNGSDIPTYDGSGDYGGQPWFVFDVKLNVPTQPTDEDAARIRGQIHNYKNKRSRLRNLIYNAKRYDGVSVPTYNGSTSYDGGYIEHD